MLEYIPILIMISLAAIIAVAIVGASYVLDNRTARKVKLSPYECGMISTGPARRKNYGSLLLRSRFPCSRFILGFPTPIRKHLPPVA